MKFFYSLLLPLLALLIAAPAFAETLTQPSPQSEGAIAWIVVGLIVGFAANRMVSKTWDGTLRDATFGMIGALVGGMLFRGIRGPSLPGFNAWSILAAFVLAVAALLTYHAFRGEEAGSAGTN